MNTRIGLVVFPLAFGAILVTGGAVLMFYDQAAQRQMLEQKARTVENLLKKEERQLQQEPADELLRQVGALRARLVEGAKSAIPADRVARMLDQWRSTWEVTEREAQLAPLGSRRILVLAAVPRGVAEWPLLARAVEEASQQPGVHLTDLQVLASGEADQRKLERVEFTLVVHQRSEGSEQTKGAL